MKKRILFAALFVSLLLFATTASASVNSFPQNTSLEFKYKAFLGGQTLPVYSGPGYNYWRGANGNAKVTTDEPIYIAGWDGNWLLVTYGTSKGSRTGYVCADDMADNMSAKTLTFEYSTRRITQQCNFTDDTSSTNNPIGYLSAGSYVTYLTDFYNGMNWAYVETDYNGKPIRGFVPAHCIQ